MIAAAPSNAVSPPAFDREAVARELTREIEGEVRFGLHDRMLYATDASIYQVEPLGVVVPASVEDAVRAVRFCAARGLPILPRGGGTSLAGQCTNRAVVIDFSANCRGLLSVDSERRSCRVEPGVTLDWLNEQLKPRGLFFTPDPATSRHANIGGVIGNNGAGMHSILYGRTAENLLGVDVALADGRRVTLNEGAAMRDPVAAELTAKVASIIRPIAPVIRARFPRTVRRNAGYALDMILSQLEAGGGGFERVNLAHLICGSEGTLAVTLGAELALHPLPKRKGLAVVAFGTLDAAMDALMGILTLKPAAVELLDDLIMSLARANLEYRRYVDLLPQPVGGREVQAVHFVEFFGETDAEITAKFDALTAMFGPDAVQRHTDAASMANAWKLRKAGEPLLHAIPGERKPLGFVEDNAVPPERLAEFVRGFRSIVEREGTRASFYAHASVGVLHVRPLLSLRDPRDTAAMERIAWEVAELARSLGGVMSGEHGDGRVRGPLLERFFGPEIMAAFRAVKGVFDPRNLLNPGNIVTPGPLSSIHAMTRIRPRQRLAEIPPVETYYDYADQGDFAHAVEMCNGAGVCRKKTGGVMCPSYMGTLDERHSTRGRGNALRLAISGQLDLRGEAAWKDPETEKTLDLCLSCKACKSECPSNVDIARLKAEYTAQGYKAAGGAPLRAQFFGRVHALSAMASVMPGVSNFFATWGPTRAVMNAALGLHPARTLPAFHRPLHKQWTGRSQPRSRVAAETSPVVVLYGDTFTTYNEPAIGLAARDVLEAFGYRVELHRGNDCGRAMMSVGLLEEAIGTADREIARLARIAERPEVAAIVFLEPSVLSAVKDDWLSLKLATPMHVRRSVAAKSWLVEHFLADAWEQHPGRPAVAAATGRVLLHGHCHQKALWGASSSAALLERLFPGRVTTLDTTCCGMAGSFGYTRSRYGVAMKIGELGVLPAARSLAKGDVFVAPGTSCRHQVHDGAGARAVHPIELVAASLLSESPPAV